MLNEKDGHGNYDSDHVRREHESQIPLKVQVFMTAGFFDLLGTFFGHLAAHPVAELSDKDYELSEVCDEVAADEEQ